MLNQPEEDNLPMTLESNKFNQFPEKVEAKNNQPSSKIDWYPEDEDEWYEPDYTRGS